MPREKNSEAVLCALLQKYGQIWMGRESCPFYGTEYYVSEIPGGWAVLDDNGHAIKSDLDGKGESCMESLENLLYLIETARKNPEEIKIFLS